MNEAELLWAPHNAMSVRRVLWAQKRICYEHRITLWAYDVCYEHKIKMKPRDTMSILMRDKVKWHQGHIAVRTDVIPTKVVHATPTSGLDKIATLDIACPNLVWLINTVFRINLNIYGFTSNCGHDNDVRIKMIQSGNASKLWKAAWTLRKIGGKPMCKYFIFNNERY